MWMMGYNELGGVGGEVNVHESSFNGNSRRLRPLIPRPLPSNSINDLNSSPHSNHPYFFSPYQHLGEQSKRELNSTSSATNNATPQVVASSRWNPTPEQLRVLEELYRRGTRTPSAEQIQHITAQLRRYGKIEGKNVFYWFQNHKARERQKRRRQMETTSAPSLVVDELDIFSNHRDNNIKELGSVFEVEQTKNWSLSSNCSISLAEDSHVSMKRAVSENNNINFSNNNINSNINNNNNKVVAESIVSAMQSSECVKTDGWFQLAEFELHNTRIHNNNNINDMNIFLERNATWHKQLPCPDPLLLTNLINSASSTNNNSSNIIVNNNTCSTKTMLDLKSIKTTTTLSDIEKNGLITRSCGNNLSNVCVISQIEDNSYSDDICPRDDESQTLQLFPLRSGCDFASDKGTITGINASAPSQFFEFLPLKN